MSIQQIDTMPKPPLPALWDNDLAYYVGLRDQMKPRELQLFSDFVNQWPCRECERS